MTKDQAIQMLRDELNNIYTANWPGMGDCDFVHWARSRAGFTLRATENIQEPNYCPDCGKPSKGVVHTCSPQVEADTYGWLSGAPHGFRAEEWFIAETNSGERVVLRALPEEYVYDFTTQDGTYLKRGIIKCWMPFPDSEYSPPQAQEDRRDRLEIIADLVAANKRIYELEKSVRLSRIKDHQIAEAVNELTNITIKYYDHQSLRQRISKVVLNLVRGE